MSIKAKVTKKEPAVEAGMYVARAYAIVHTGTSYNEYLKKDVDEVRITFELPTELKVFKEGEDALPVALSESYTLSMYKKANLRQVIEGITGKILTDDEADDYELLDILGKPCMVNVVDSKDGKYSNIASVTPLMKGVKMPKAVNIIQVFDFNENFTTDVDELYPEFITEKIKASDEWKARLQAINDGTDDGGLGDGK